MSNSILRLKQVLAYTGLSKSTIYDYVAKGKFPVPIKLGSRSIGWRESEVLKWQDNLPSVDYNA